MPKELTPKQKWYKTMRKKLGVRTDEAVRAHMREVGKLSPGNNAGNQGFVIMSKERLKEVARNGGLKGKKIHEV